jgi:membrane-anchored protein YejM (alkaline phosphatase superfamily)
VTELVNPTLWNLLAVVVFTIGAIVLAERIIRNRYRLKLRSKDFEVLIEPDEKR